MTGSIYEVRAEGHDGEVHGFGARSSREEGEALLAERMTTHEGARGWRRWWLEEIDTRGHWQPPPAPTPRSRYRTRVTDVNAPGTWPMVHVEVLDGEQVVAEFDRNYSMVQTFEPFRQGSRDLALISPHYTATSVLDLRTGTILASEAGPGGFCPVGFYVPDWWDIHDGTRLFAGSLSWRPLDHEWPTGQFGFVWGCVWGDDSSWKVQYLDLSRVSEGVVSRDDRFGYLRLAMDPERDVRDVIRCSSWEGRRRVEFHVERHFELDTGLEVPDDDL